MAAPTDVRVEATSITTTILRWTYSGLNHIAVYRSTDGASYAEVTSAYGNTRVVPGTTTYTDTGLSVGTKYWYKLSDNSGSTFSSVVTVWTHSCVGPIGLGSKPVQLPRFDEAEVATLLGDTSQVPGFSANPDEATTRLNEMARRIEAAFQGQEVEPDACIACPADGALVIDCSDGCKNWEVVTEDGDEINSVSINWCDKFDGTIDFVIPPGATVRVCGFPAGFGFGGDECTQAPISGGTNGRRMAVNYGGSGGGGGKAGGSSGASSPGTGKGVGRGVGAGGGGGGGGSGCTCVPGQLGQLVIKSCNANNSLNCASSKSLSLIACGGTGPYTWSKTGSVVLSKTTGVSTTVTPPTNTGSGVAGTAFRKWWLELSGGAGTNIITSWRAAYGCNDQDLASYSTTSSCISGSPNCATPTCFSFFTLPFPGAFGVSDLLCGLGNSTGGECFGGGPFPESFCGPSSQQAAAAKVVEDTRSAGMISSGCNPCSLQAGATVTVTDSLGTQVTIVLRA